MPPGTRMRFAKNLILRAMRLSTHHQIAFNRAILAAVAELRVRMQRLEADTSAHHDLSRHPAVVDRKEDIASMRFELVELQLQLAERQATNAANTTNPKSMQPPHAGASFLVSEPSADRPPNEPPRPSARRAIPGINVFGDWAATTGLAQAARRLTVALHDAGFDLSLGKVHSGAPRDDRRVPDVLRRLRDDRPHVIDVWMLNVNEFPVISDDLLRPTGRDTYSIGVWYWELPTFPERLIAQMSRVDEIWVATSFVQASFRSATDRPVHVVPAIVPELKGTGRRRQDIGLTDDEVVFLFSFDVNSMVARKNPGAVIEAFGRAFPPSVGHRSRLVIKVLNLARQPEFAQWLRAAVTAVNGVLIEEDLSDAELADLFLCADAYVSLHRSEGFGFGIAEAMSVGKPVIATAYSGNLDFATAANSLQVGYRLCEITSADHTYNEDASETYPTGAVWADPDVGQAARWMKLLAADPGLRKRLGEAGRATIRERYSARPVVGVVTDRLSEIAKGIGADRL